MGGGLSSDKSPDDVKIKGATDDTLIGNTRDALRISSKDDVYLSLGQTYCVNMEYVLNSGQSVYQAITTPDTSTRIHLKYRTYSSARSEIQLWEAPTGVSDNWSWTPRNRNRESSNTAAALVKNIDQPTTNGTFICKESNYGSGISVNSSAIAHSQEFILDQDTVYLFVMKSYEAGNLTTLQLQWYEI